MKLIKKIRQVSNRINSNPISKDNFIKSFLFYLYFNSISFFIQKKFIVKGVNNILFIIKKGDAGLVGNYYYGLYEFEDSMFTIHFLRENDCFLDVGSNLGHFSLIASGVSKAKTIAIEPVPCTYSRMLEQIKINKLENKIEALNIGLADVNSFLFFSTDIGTMNKIVDTNYPNKVKVNVTTLDILCKDIDNLSLIKIDVEGYEDYVINGGVNTFSNKKLKAIIIELNNSGKAYKIKDIDVYQKLLAFDFIPYKYNPLNRELLKLDTYNRQNFNTIFIRDIDFVKKRIISSKYYKIWNKSY
jgi:FkbM family methyltransferase